MSDDKPIIFLILTWITEDGRQHHKIFNENRKRNKREAEAEIKELWQASVLSDEKSKQIKSMSLFEGIHIDWEREEATVVKTVTLTYPDDCPFEQINSLPKS